MFEYKRVVLEFLFHTLTGVVEKMLHVLARKRSMLVVTTVRDSLGNRAKGAHSDLQWSTVGLNTSNTRILDKA